jgi:hypothetical protein
MNFTSPEGIVHLEELAGVVGRLPPDRQSTTACQCSVDAVGSHNMRYSIDTANLSRWKVWVAVDAELRPLPDGDSQTISKREAIDAHLTQQLWSSSDMSLRTFQNTLQQTPKRPDMRRSGGWADPSSS